MTKAEDKANALATVADTPPQGDVLDGRPQDAVMFGNEPVVSNPRPPRVKTTHTQEEWLVEATEAKTVLERGDHVSPQLIEMLFLDAYDVIEGFTPAARGKKKAGDKDDDDDQDKRNRG